MIDRVPRHVRLDPVGGIAGDMFAAALLDAFPGLEAGLAAALETAGILELATVRRLDHLGHALSGSRFEVRAIGNDHPVGPGHAHHRHHRDIQEFLRSAQLPDRVRERALDIFDRLARAEASVHGVTPEDVSFHEVGQWDSITDIVTAAWLIEALGDTTWSSEPLPLGRGRVAAAHGSLPVPAPATAVLLEGLPTFQDEHRGERVTPTGAAIVRHLDPSFDPAPGVLRLERSGTGFGTAVFEGLSNTLRVLVFERVESGNGRSLGCRTDRVTVCTFEIDDQSGEDLAVALDRVRAVAGVLDVVQSPVFGKKGRLAVQVQVLVVPEASDRARAACFRETTTLGIRWQTVERSVLDREERVITVGDQEVGVKQALRPGGQVTAKAASDDLAATGGGRRDRECLRRKAEAIAAASDAGFEDTDAG